MKILMLGWEFPPYNKGGLGTACYGLTRGLNHHGVDVTFVLPKAKNSTKDHSTHVNLILANKYFLDNSKISFHLVDSLLTPYATQEYYEALIKGEVKTSGDGFVEDDDVYGKNLYQEVQRFTEKTKLIAYKEDYDLIHAHDWMTYGAGIAAREISGKPLVIHVHATEYDRTAGNPNQFVYNIERNGMAQADQIIAVSQFTKNKIVKYYGVDPNKVEVVHNAVTFNDNKFDKDALRRKSNQKYVLFLGRITVQKGPDYFLQSAKQILDHVGDSMDIKFIFAGTGDMEEKMIHESARLGISKHVLFAGWVSGKELDKLYSMADLYVMPSISEPFGITPLEAMRNGTPCLISNQSGVSEVVDHCLKVDFWDIDGMSNKIISVLKHSPLHQALKMNACEEIKKFNWNDPAEKCIDVYDKTVSKFAD